MASIRVKITGAYVGLLVAAIAAFGAVLYAASRAAGYRELAQIAAGRGDLALAIVAAARETEGSIFTSSDSLIGPIITPRVRTLLDVVPEYVLLFDTAGRLVHGSRLVRALLPAEVEQLTAAASTLSGSGAAVRTGLVRVQDQLRQEIDEVVLVERRSPKGDSAGIERAVAGVSARGNLAGRGAPFVTLLAIAPLILAAAVTGAHLIARRAFQPVDEIINEVAAITDGRSLHRRLPVAESGDELARLSATLNAMISRLETSFGALRRFTADASHELKTPLTVLRADVERAMHAPNATTEQLVALEEALHEITRMADLVDSLLTLARADEGRFDLHRVEVRLEPICREVFETAVILGEDAGQTVTMPVVEDARVLADRTRLRQLFLNLVTNAIKYTPRGGSVELSLTRRGDTVSFIVKDSGVGIAAADLPYVFERFWRADRARSRRVTASDGRWVDERGGFGLGLAISQWIAQAHGGTLTVNSRLNRGSTFTVQLPIAESRADESAIATVDGSHPAEAPAERA